MNTGFYKSNHLKTVIPAQAGNQATINLRYDLKDKEPSGLECISLQMSDRLGIACIPAFAGMTAGIWK